MSEPVWTFDGSAVARTSSLGAVWTTRLFEIDDAVPSDPNYKEIQLLDSLIPVGVPHLAPVRNWRLVVEADVSALAGSDISAKLRDGWAELVTAFDPCLGVVKLQSARADVTTATITRHLFVETLSAPSYTPRTGDPKANDAPGAYEGGGGYIVFPVRGRTVFPYWQGASLLTLDTAPATAELAIGAGPDTVTINNAGRRWVGTRFVAGSVSGSVTSIQIVNGANGDTFVWSNAGGFANGDYFDLLATTPYAVDRYDTANVFAGTVGDKMRLEQGSNTLTGTRGAGSGTLTLAVSWPELHLTN